MTRCLLLLLTFAHLGQTFAQEDQDSYISADAASADLDFALQGEYVPSAAVKDSTLAFQVIALGNGQFEAVAYESGLPGAGWNGTTPTRTKVTRQGLSELISANSLNRIHRSSPTLGLAPPNDAVVLFDGTESSLKEHWDADAKMSNGLLHEGCMSVDKFQSFSLHLEFMTPFKPKARGQARGNSGVYYQGRYETQVLDSFGLEGKMNETGGIYTISAPSTNMCLPPLTWQTYDVDFVAASFNAAGEKTQNAKLTVRLNGIEVQKQVELTKKTTAARLKEGPEPGPIYIQDHRNPVRFRNIWVVPNGN